MSDGCGFGVSILSSFLTQDVCNNLKKELLFYYFRFSVVLFHSLLHIMTNSHKMHWRIQGGFT